MNKITNKFSRLVLFAVAATTPLPALALSCMRADPVQTVEWLKDAGTEYAVIYGTLQFSGDLSPFTQETPHDAFPKVQAKPAVLIGKDVLTGLPYDEIIMIERQCSGIWCGGVAAGKDLLVIIEDPVKAPTLRPEACGGQFFQGIEEEALEDIKGVLLSSLK